MKQFKALLVFIKPYKYVLLLAVFCLLMVTLLNLAGPWMIRMLIQTVTAGVEGDISLQRINFLALAVISIYLLRALAQFGSNYVSHYGAWKMLRDIRQHLYEHVQQLSLKFFQDEKTGDLMSRVINDTRNFEQLLAHAVPTVISNALVFIGVAAILFYMNFSLALYTLIPIPFLAWAVLKFSIISRPHFKKAQDEISNLNAFLQDNFSGIKEIKAFTQEQNEIERARQRVSIHTMVILKALKLSATFQPVIQFISSTGTVIVIFFGGRLAFAGELPLEDLVAFLLYLGMFYEPITSLGRINEGVQHAIASAERVMDLLNTEPEIMDSPDAVTVDQVKGEIEFQKVDFNYVEDVSVIKDISFKVDPGETLALVGPTGVGKSTIARLIPRFYEPVAGKILLDQQDISDITVSSLRKQISLVSQDVFLFNDTVRENILYGQPDASEEDMIEASKAANSHQFIMELKNGYDTIVGERGVKLSGGQKQRISIARAVLKNSPVIILDEATSSVDTQTERLIQDALDKLTRNKTTIVIAHRLSTIKNADQIIVLEKGKIVEKGKHDELIKKDGLYSKLCRTQITG